MAQIRIDTDTLIMAFDDHDPLAAWYLDRETGELLRVSDDLPDDEDEESVARLEAAPERYLEIEPLPSAFGYGLMAEFTASLDEPVARAELERTLHGRRPFRAFKDALLGYPMLRERWFQFRDERFLAEAKV
jgi:hypothetical protein